MGPIIRVNMKPEKTNLNIWEYIEGIFYMQWLIYQRSLHTIVWGKKKVIVTISGTSVRKKSCRLLPCCRWTMPCSIGPKIRSYMPTRPDRTSSRRAVTISHSSTSIIRWGFTCRQCWIPGYWNWQQLLSAWHAVWCCGVYATVLKQPMLDGILLVINHGFTA